jgi:hypothetical protein
MATLDHTLASSQLQVTRSYGEFAASNAASCMISVFEIFYQYLLFSLEAANSAFVNCQQRLTVLTL